MDNAYSTARPQPETEMEHALIAIEPKSTALSSELAASSRLAADFIKASRSPNTLDAYVSDWRIFAEWCGVRKLETLPPTPNTLCMFLADEASRGRRPSTLQRRLAAIKYALEAAGVLSDTERSPTSHKSVSALATLRGPPAPLWLAVLPLTNRNFLRPMRAKPSRGSLRLSVGYRDDVAVLADCLAGELCSSQHHTCAQRRSRL